MDGTSGRLASCSACSAGQDIRPESAQMPSMRGKAWIMASMIDLALGGDQSQYWWSRISMSGYFANTSRAPASRSSAVVLPAMPDSMTILPLPFSSSASHCACRRPNSVRSCMTSEVSFSVAMSPPKTMTGIPFAYTFSMAGMMASATVG